MSKQHHEAPEGTTELPPEKTDGGTDTVLSSGDQVEAESVQFWNPWNPPEPTLEEALAGVKISVLAQVIEDRLRKMLANGVPVEESLTCAHGLRTRMEVYDASPEPGSPST